MAALVAAAAALVLLGAGASALSGSDSLISLGYLTETFQPSAQKQADSAAEQILQGTYDAAVKKMDQLAQGTGTGDSRPYSGSFSGYDVQAFRQDRKALRLRDDEVFRRHAAAARARFPARAARHVPQYDAGELLLRGEKSRIDAATPHPPGQARHLPPLGKAKNAGIRAVLSKPSPAGEGGPLAVDEVSCRLSA